MGQAMQRDSESLWLCRTWSRPCQAFWEFRVLVEAGHIDLILGEVFCLCKVSALGTNLIGHPTECPLTLQANDLTGDPGLDAFTDDGTPGNGHFPLLSTSQAINKGNDAACTPTDQLGQPRVGQCDIGAIEFQPSDTTPPTVTIALVTPDTLWPPNGKLVPVTVSGTITDAGSGVAPSTATFEVKDEYGLIQPRGQITTLDMTGNYTFTIQLQASRKGNDKDGRQYTITVSAEDDAGNTGSATAIVTVPHDQGQRRNLAAFSVIWRNFGR
jgi:hypothetical protein